MLFGAIIALGVLVTIHEFGHFWVARRCGVHVIRFSIGFGKPLLRWHDRRGTEYVIAMIPLGGYVKMLDERETDTVIPPEKLAYAFNRKSVGKRMAIVVAGPVANFILALFIFFILALVGTKEPIPLIGKVIPESIVSNAGIKPMSEIIAIDGVLTPTWADVSLQLFKRLGETGTITFTVKEAGQQGKNYSLVINDWLRGAEQPDVFTGVGLRPYRPPMQLFLNRVAEGGAAERAGLKIGDRLESFNDKSIGDFQELTDAIKKMPNQTVTVGYEREGQRSTTNVLLAVMPDDPSLGYMGIELSGKLDWPENRLRHVGYGVGGALLKSVEQTWTFSFVTLASIKKMFTGQVSVKNLSGPISIVKVAGSSFSSGFLYFLKFLALFSISLGVLNLLPIPVLDGGHLLFYLYEWVRGRPVPEHIQGFAVQFGIFLMIGVMLFAIMNDLNWL